jgi:hypothetical protein
MGSGGTRFRIAGHLNRATRAVQDRRWQNPLLRCGDRAQREMNFTNKIKRIKALTGDQLILTWQHALSMVRPALKGYGALFPAFAALFRVSKA